MKKSYYIIPALLCLGALGTVYALNTVNSGYKTGSSTKRINAHNNCHDVRHTGSKSYFVPTKTSNEWNSFRNNLPGDVNAPACPAYEDFNAHVVYTEITGSSFASGYEMANHPANLQELCAFKGYGYGRALSSKGFTSPGNNGVYIWNGSAFAGVGASGWNNLLWNNSNPATGANFRCYINNPGLDCYSTDGAQILHGQAATLYTSKNVAWPGPCNGQARTCNNGTLSGNSSYQFGSCKVGENPHARCFTKDTLITMSDGSKKEISLVEVGDTVLGGNGEANRVVDIDRSQLGGRQLYSFNGGNHFVTSEHPFKTKDGWKSIDIEALRLDDENLISKLDATYLQIGDEIIMQDGSTLLIESISAQDAEEQIVYNLKLTGDGVYYADGYMTHHKY